MLNKEIFQILFHLMKMQPWLAEKSLEVEHLLFNECESSSEKNLILNLLNRFKYITNEYFVKDLNQIVEKITSEEKYEVDNTIIAATTIDSSADSAQYVLYAMKQIFQKYDWDTPKLINNTNRIVREFPSYSNVVFVDEFIGSGKTMLGRISKLKRDLKDKDISEYSLRIYAIAACKTGAQLLEQEGIELFSSITLAKGISDFYIEDKEEKIDFMRRLESLLLSEFEGRPMPSMGFGKVEALYVRENGNTPNSVFPIFWWRYYANRTKRPTILLRSMGDA